MRSFLDEAGREWDVVVGRESWGAFFATFVPGGSDDEDREVRQTQLEASDGVDAGRALDERDDDGLRELLSDSRPKELG